jgi:hypothetical protein
MLSRSKAFVMTPGVSLDHRLTVKGNDTPMYILANHCSRGTGRQISIIFRIRSRKIRVTDALVLEPLFSAYDSIMSHPPITSAENVQAKQIEARR